MTTGGVTAGVTGGATTTGGGATTTGGGVSRATGGGAGGVTGIVIGSAGLTPDGSTSGECASQIDQREHEQETGGAGTEPEAHLAAQQRRVFLRHRVGPGSVPTFLIEPVMLGMTWEVRRQLCSSAGDHAIAEREIILAELLEPLRDRGRVAGVTADDNAASMSAAVFQRSARSTARPRRMIGWKDSSWRQQFGPSHSFSSDSASVIAGSVPRMIS